MTKVLVTKNITPNQLRLIMEAELEFEIETAIEFSIDFKTNVVIQAIKEKSDWIFTSINAVKSILPILTKYQNKFEQKIYCIGKGSYNLLTKLGYFSVTAFENKEEFNEKFDWNETAKLTYFCNNKRKGFLPQNVPNKEVEINFVEVFKTSLLKPVISSSDFDFILYFSPLGVKSILAHNPKLKSIKSICPGPSTLDVLKENGVKNCHISDSPQLKSMIEYIQSSIK